MQRTSPKRDLPAQPSLEYLRKEAKHELAQLRARAGSAQLADAQLLLARTYGFSSWRSLKAEVDRRRAALGLTPPLLLGEGFPRPRRVTSFRAAVLSPGGAEQAAFGAITIPMLALQGAPALMAIGAALFG